MLGKSRLGLEARTLLLHRGNEERRQRRRIGTGPKRKAVGPDNVKNGNATGRYFSQYKTNHGDLGGVSGELPPYQMSGCDQR